MEVQEREDSVLPFPVAEHQAVSNPGADLGHIEALLSNSWPLSEHQVQEGKTRPGPPAWRERRDRQGGKKRSHTETLSVEAQLGSGARASSSEQETFCKLCECWVPGRQRDRVWQQHVHSRRHRRAVTTSNYRKYVLPEKRAAAEELRLQTCASKTPSMGSAAKAAAAVRCEHEDRIQSLHADVCKEMLHHSGATADYHRLMSRLSPDRLAVAMPYTSTRLRSNVGADGSLTFLSASPATIACLAVLLPETHATTLVLSGSSGHALDLAASTAALCLLVGRLRKVSQLQCLQISMLRVIEDGGGGTAQPHIASCSAEISMLTAIEDGGGGTAQQHMAGRHAQPEMRVLRSLKDAMQCNSSLRLLSLKANYPAMLAHDWADLQAAAAKAPEVLRIAFLTGLHSRSYCASPLISLPRALLREILDMAIPASPCKVFLS